MNISISPRVQATKNIKKYFVSKGFNSFIRSKVTNKKGYEVYINIKSELSYSEFDEFNKFIDGIQKQFNIDHITVVGGVPF